MRELWECNWWRQYWVFQSFWFERNAFPLKTKSRRLNGSWFGPKTRGHLFAWTLCLFPCNWWLIKWKVLTSSADIFYPGIQVRQPQFYNELLNVTKMIQGVMTSGCVWPNISLPGPPIWCLDTGNHCIAGMDNIRFPSRDSILKVQHGIYGRKDIILLI